MSGTLLLIAGHTNSGTSTQAEFFADAGFERFSGTDRFTHELDLRGGTGPYDREQLDAISEELRVEDPAILARDYVALARSGVDVVVDSPRNLWEVKYALDNYQHTFLFGLVCPGLIGFNRALERGSERDPKTWLEYYQRLGRESQDPEVVRHGQHVGAIMDTITRGMVFDTHAQNEHQTFFGMLGLLADLESA